MSTAVPRRRWSTSLTAVAKITGLSIVLDAVHAVREGHRRG